MLIPLLLLETVGAVVQFTLNVPNVLLPKHIPDTLFTNFTLAADAGCFSWMSTKEHVVTVKPALSPAESGCSRRAELTAVSQEADRQLSIILAHEIGTGSELRVDVFVDVIERITIKTTSLELLLEETPSTFEVIAFDEDGNTFSTLEGVEYTWSIEPDEAHVSGDVLRIIRYSDSSYLTPPTIGLLEQQGKQGDKVLVQGINTGIAWVKTRLSHPTYAGVSEVAVRVVVVENLLLNPPYDVWVLPLTQILYKAERRQHGKKTEIRIPSDQYSMSLSNTTVANIKDTTVTSLVMGDTDVMLVDKNMQDLPLGTPPHTTVHVVPPSALVFKIHEQNWNLETNTKYNFTITVLGPNSRPVRMSDNIRIKISVDSSHFTVVSSNLQGTHHVIRARDIGQTKITAVLDTMIHPITQTAHPVEPLITSQQTAVIRSPVVVTPIQVLIPLYHKQPYVYKLVGSGGSGQYTWSSNSPATVGVNQDGQVSGRDVGTISVTAADIKNGDNSASTTVIVSELSGLVFLPAKVETLVGTKLRLNLAAYVELQPGTKVAFTRCHLVPLLYSMSNELFVMEEEEQPTGDLSQGVCSILTISAKRPGNTIVRVSYTTSTKQLLSATVTVAAYPPLALIHPAHTPVLTLGSSYILTLSGGPQPWILDKSGYSQDLSTSGGYLATLASTGHHSVSADKRSYGVSHNFRLTCTSLGEQTGLVTITNKITKDNPFPAGELITVKILCAVPAVLTLSHRLPLDPTRCPATNSIPVLLNQNVKLLYSALTSEHLLFDNSSSLLFEFKSSDQSRISLERHLVWGLVSSTSEITSHFKSESGHAELTLTVDGYQEDHLSSAGLDAGLKLDVSLLQTLKFLLVREITVEPPSVTLFNYEDRDREMRVEGGSGVFSVTSERGDVVTLSSTSTSPFTIRPRLQGVTMLTVQDLCLPGQNARAKVHVTGAADVVIDTISKVEVFRYVHLTVTVVDSNQRKISSEVYSKLDLQSQISTDHIALQLSEDQSQCDEYCQVYRVDGVSQGVSTIHFTVSHQGGLIRSNNQIVTVFPPLVLSPSPVVLLEGAVFQLRYSGGPPHDTSLEFSSPNTTTATINQRALVTGVRVGTVDVHGRCVSPTSDTVVYSQHSVQVKVVKLRGVVIRAPSTYIIQGAKVPLTVWGLDNLGPFTFTSISGVSYSWRTSSPALALHSLYKKSGYTVEDEKQFVISVLGVSEGVTIVTVVVSYTDANNKVVTHSDSVSIQVMKLASLVAPQQPLLLLGLGAVYSIRTNKDHTNTVQYSVLEGSHVASVDKDGTVKALTMGTVSVKLDVIEDRNINQTILLHIEVKRAFAVLVSDNGDIQKAQSHYGYHTVPLGMSTSFQIETRDDIGRVFDGVSTSTIYHYTLNRMDVVTVGSVKANNTLSVTGQQVGEAVMHIKSVDELEAWLYIRVTSPLQIPLYTILYHSTVCLPAVTQADSEGVWVSKDASIVTLKDGHVSGVGVGTTTISQQVTSATHSMIQIAVVKVDSIKIQESREPRPLSNIATPQTVAKLQLPVTIATTKPLSKLALSCDKKASYHQIEFRCSSSSPSVVTAAAVYISGAPHCVATVQPNSIVTALTPYVTATVDGVVSSAVRVNFAPKFSLIVGHVTLSADSPTVDVTLSQGDINLIQVVDGGYMRDLKVIRTSTHLHITLLNWGEAAQHTVTLLCQQTGQQEVLDVSIVARSLTDPIPLQLTLLTKTLLPTLVLGLLVFLIITGIVFLTTASYRRLTLSHHDPVCYITSPSSPLRTSPFRPVSPSRVTTPLYTRPQGTPGTN